MSKTIGVVRFLGTNCDRDVWQAVETLGLTPKWLWYEDQFNANDYAGYIVPGGFSYGDYLRSGALAAKAPVLKSISEAAAKGQPVLGICNGFQILTEARLLPGALVRNEGRKFIDKWVTLKPENKTQWTNESKPMRLPVAHGDGRYYVESDDLKKIEDKGQIWLRYEDNPNGSIQNIAGVSNEMKNVCGLMPHPERAMQEWMGGTDGHAILGSLARSL